MSLFFEAIKRKKQIKSTWFVVMVSSVSRHLRITAVRADHPLPSKTESLAERPKNVHCLNWADLQRIWSHDTENTPGMWIDPLYFFPQGSLNGSFVFWAFFPLARMKETCVRWKDDSKECWQGTLTQYLGVTLMSFLTGWITRKPIVQVWNSVIRIKC